MRNSGPISTRIYDQTCPFLTKPIQGVTEIAQCCFFGGGRENRQITPPGQGSTLRKEGSVRHPLTKNPARSFSCPGCQVCGLSFGRFPRPWQKAQCSWVTIRNSATKYVSRCDRGICVKPYLSGRNLIKWIGTIQRLHLFKDKSSHLLAKMTLLSFYHIALKCVDT